MDRRPVRPADKAWLALVTYIVLYEALCEAGELMSEGYDRYVDKHPVAARVAPFVVAAHLTNLLPTQLDPLAWVFYATRLASRRKAP